MIGSGCGARAGAEGRTLTWWSRRTHTAPSRSPRFLDGQQRGPSRPTSPFRAAIHGAPEICTGTHRPQQTARQKVTIFFEVQSHQYEVSMIDKKYVSTLDC